jgi:hypothetical protein
LIKNRIYLDNCCLNRPYDDLDNLNVQLEAEAKLFIQDEITREGIGTKEIKEKGFFTYC